MKKETTNFVLFYYGDDVWMSFIDENINQRG